MRRSYKGISINTSHNTHEKVFSLLTKNKDAKIIDIPSGSGAFILRLKDNGYKNVTAVDIENILDIDHDDFFVGDMTKKLPFPDKSYDAVVCIDGIEHISTQFDFVKEVSRILKDNGEFIVSTPNISSLRSRWRWFTTGHHHKCNSPLDEANPTPLHHIGMVSYPEIRYMLHINNLKITKVTTNRAKAVSWSYIFMLPFIYLATKLVYQKAGKKEGTTKVNNEIFKTMMSKSILFGETMVVKAIKVI